MRCLIFWCVWLPLFPLTGHAAGFDKAVSGFLELVSDRSSHACIMVADPEGRVIIEKNPRDEMIPASILKIVTANAAMDYLKPDYRFFTDVYTDADGNLLIKGFGDPYLVSEEIEIIAKKLYRDHFRSFRSIFVDTTAFRDELPAYLSDSNNPYDAVNGALVVNFNTVFVGKDRQGNIYSAETQTPLTQVSLELGSRLGVGRKERFNTGSEKETHERYVMELFSEIFARNGVTINGIGSHKKVDSRFRLIFRHMNTRNLRQVVTGLMAYSNNFIANQIMINMGAEYFGYPTDLSQGIKAFRRVTREIHPDFDGMYHLAEASGLSRENRVSCQFMIAALESYRPYYETMPFRSSSYYKTGSLTGVNNLAGYIKHKNRLYPFVMMLYTTSNERFRLMGILENLIRLKYAD